MIKLKINGQILVRKSDADEFKLTIDNVEVEANFKEGICSNYAQVAPIINKLIEHLHALKSAINSLDVHPNEQRQYITGQIKYFAVFGSEVTHIIHFEQSFQRYSMHCLDAMIENLNTINNRICKNQHTYSGKAARLLA